MLSARPFGALLCPYNGPSENRLYHYLLRSRRKRPTRVPCLHAYFILQDPSAPSSMPCITSVLHIPAAIRCFIFTHMNCLPTPSHQLRWRLRNYFHVFQELWGRGIHDADVHRHHARLERRCRVRRSQWHHHHCELQHQCVPYVCVCMCVLHAFCMPSILSRWEARGHGRRCRRGPSSLQHIHPKWIRGTVAIWLKCRMRAGKGTFFIVPYAMFLECVDFG